MLERVTLEPAAPANAAVIWLHGLGADGNDFVPIVAELGLPPSIQARFIFPHAPLRPITINAGYVMRGWYDIVDLQSLRREDGDGIRASARAIEALIAEQTSAGVPAARIVLAGFSQGAAVALHTGLRHEERLAGIVALSGYLPFAATLAAEAHRANAGTPIFLAHGTYDDVVPPHLGERTRAALTQAMYPVEWHAYPMPHSVCDAEVGDIGDFLRRVLA
jgi:phospholipase/carboxylesterase